MTYDLVFEASGGNDLWFPAFGLVFITIGAMLTIFRERLPENLPPSVRRVGPLVFLGFAILWTTAATIATVGGNAALARTLREDRCEVVEGVVTEFQPMPPGGKGMESFTVGGKRFEYSDHVITSGFHQTASNGGPIRNGVRVRIHHVGNDIARLEVAR